MRAIDYSFQPITAGAIRRTEAEMNVKELPRLVRSWVDFIVGWALWLAVTLLIILFAAAIIRMLGYSIPFVPKIDVQPLVWAAGFVYLIGKR